MGYRVPDKHRVECDNCYGHGCSYCSARGWFESAEGREEREEAEDRHADEMREEQAIERAKP